MLKIKKEQLFNYLANNYSNNTLIKFFSCFEYAQQFANGFVCMGTLQYYRDSYEGDGRGDKTESINLFPYVAGQSFFHNDEQYCVDLDDKNGTLLDVEIRITALALCFFNFVNSETTKCNLNKLIFSEESLGQYICVIKNKSILINQLTRLKCIKCLDNSKAIPVINYERSCGGFVEYVDNPSGNGFQKKNEEKYMVQQEFRFVFGFTADGYKNMIKGLISSRFLFSIDDTIDVDIIETI